MTPRLDENQIYEDRSVEHMSQYDLRKSQRSKNYSGVQPLNLSQKKMDLQMSHIKALEELKKKMEMDGDSIKHVYKKKNLVLDV